METNYLAAPLHALLPISYTGSSSLPLQITRGRGSRSIYSGKFISGYGELHISNVLSSAELSAGIVCSCMPVCASLLRGHIPKKFPYPSLRHIYFNLRSRSSRRPLVSNQTHSLGNLQPLKRDSYLEVWSKDYTQLEDGSGREEMKPSVLTQRERLEY